MIEVTVKHNFETGHRLPHLPGKCQNLHGHSWWASVTVHAPDVDASGILVDFGQLKKGVRGWIDTYLDHGLMLGQDDPLRDLLQREGKVFTFGPELGNWPTVENVARLLVEVTEEVLSTIAGETPGLEAAVQRVVVRETHVNEASWVA